MLRSVHEEARDEARRLASTPEFARSRDERKKVEMLFAHLKTTLRFERMRLRGLSGARDEFLLAAGPEPEAFSEADRALDCRSGLRRLGKPITSGKSTQSALTRSRHLVLSRADI